VGTDVRKISSYPAAVHTLRGVGGDLLILEEAAFIDMELFLQVRCVPRAAGQPFSI
tara:strand:- start:926 stop:1093 length:168 start_codon:yes stop_codon:yes gene_type:complete